MHACNVLHTCKPCITVRGYNHWATRARYQRWWCIFKSVFRIICMYTIYHIHVSNALCACKQCIMYTWIVYLKCIFRSIYMHTIYHIHVNNVLYACKQCIIYAWMVYLKSIFRSIYMHIIYHIRVKSVFKQYV